MAPTESRLVIVAGTSGAGNSTALRALEDLDFFTIDNLPIPFLPQFLTLAESNLQYRYTAIILDTRNPTVVEHLVTLLKDLKRERIELMYLDASTEVLLRRYSETRRPHPYFDPQRDQTMGDAIQRERELLIPFKEIAHVVIDTSTLTVHDLRRRVQDYAQQKLQRGREFRINLVSFGFKHGLPLDCDLLVDVRFLPNPHFVEGLRDKTGQDQAVKDFVLQQPDSKEFLAHYHKLLEFLLPRYAHEGKSFLNIGIGCTGGRHRSVTLTEALASQIDKGKYTLTVIHRDLKRS